MKQPIPNVANEDVERVASRDFPMENSREVLAMLSEYGTDSWHREIARVRLAALKLAGGDLSRLRSAIETAKRDYRDVLAGAEYPAYSRYVGPLAALSADERRRMIDADWRQYSEWLARQS